MRVQGIDHVALEVPDVAAAAAWYGEVLGLERRHAESWGDVPTMMCAGTTCLALFPRPPGMPEVERRQRPGLRHLAFRVDRENFERAQRELAARSISCVLEDHEIAQSLYFTDPYGYELELTTYEVGGEAA